MEKKINKKSEVKKQPKSKKTKKTNEKIAKKNELKTQNQILKILNILKSNKIICALLFVVLPYYGVYKFYEFDFSEYSSIMLFLSLICISLGYKRYKEINNKNILMKILALLYSMMYVYGTIIERHLDNIFYDIFRNDVLMTLLYIYSFTVICTYIINELMYRLNNINSNEFSKKVNWKNWIIIFVLIFLSCVPYLIAWFPGLVSPDSFAQMSQALGNSDFSNHHPLAHTLLIKLCFSIGGVFGDINTKVATYSVVQMIIQSLCFTYFIVFIKKNGCSKLLLLAFMAFYMFMPVFGYYSVTMWKDILFGCFVLLLMIQLYKHTILGSNTKLDYALLIISIVLVSLFRSNGVYVTIALSIVMLIFMKEKRKLVTYLFLIPSVSSFLLVSVGYKVIGIHDTEFVENLAIPLKQISGVVAEGLDIPKDTKKYVNELVGIDTIKQNYNLVSVDSIKFNPNFNNKMLEDNKGEFFSHWFKLLIKYPSKYVDIYLKSTYGFWYLESEGYSVHLWEADQNDLGIKTNYTDFTRKVIDYHEKAYTMPIIKYVMRPATFFIVCLFGMFVAITKKKYNYLYSLSLPILVWGTIMIATPCTYQSRYVYSLFCTFPFLLYIIHKINLKNIEK